MITLDNVNHKRCTAWLEDEFNGSIDKKEVQQYFNNDSDEVFYVESIYFIGDVKIEFHSDVFVDISFANSRAKTIAKRIAQGFTQCQS